MEKRDGFIPKEDIEFERELRQQEQEEKALREKLEAERREAEEKARAEYERGLQDRKIELMKLKQGVIESSDVVKEEKSEKVRLTAAQRISGAWYRSKWLIIFIVVIAAAFIFITYDTLTAEKPDYTMLVISGDSALYYRTLEVEEFMESYCDDLNGDGKVNVLVYNISVDYTNPANSTASQAQLMSQLQSGENVILISDRPTDFELIDFRGQYPDDENINEYGLLLNCRLTRDALKWEAMPEDLYLGIRSPARLLSTTQEDMQRNVDMAMTVFERIREAVRESEK